MTLFDNNGPNNGQHNNDASKPARRDAAVTAEFNYIDDWGDDSEANADRPAAELRLQSAAQSADLDPVTRAVHGADFYDPQRRFDAGAGASAVVNTPQIGAGTWGVGFDQPQVSGVFSRYEEETQGGDSDEFDLFEDLPSEPTQPENPLKEIVSTHARQIRRLHKQVAYQKEIIQVISELLVETRVIDRAELKKRLRALRQKSR